MEDSKSILQINQLSSGILQLILNRPEALNALNADLMKQLNDVFLMAKKNREVKALLITGTGKAFCAGADIKQLEKLNGQSGLEFAYTGQNIFRNLEQLGKPSLAAINGFALGGGCELAMSATLRIAAVSAAFGQPEVKLGVIPGFGGTQRLARLVGKGRALDLCLTGRLIKADEALQWGLVSETVANDALLTRSIELLENIVRLPSVALRSVMMAIDRGYDMTLEEGFELEAVYFGLCCATQDKQEGVKAFLEKRSAEFCGE